MVISCGRYPPHAETAGQRGETGERRSSAARGADPQQARRGSLGGGGDRGGFFDHFPFADALAVAHGYDRLLRLNLYVPGVILTILPSKAPT